ncbi:MAG: tetratricopeptide repeat protein [Myxococcales bacterium]|nr:tetratricopeptide repeat protein [Myxococcales bacterium]
MVLSFQRGAFGVRRAAALVALSAFGLGCSAEKGELAQELDRLRTEVASLRSQTSALSERIGAVEGARPVTPARAAGGAARGAAGEETAAQPSDRPALAVVRLGPESPPEAVSPEAESQRPPPERVETSVALASFEKAKKLFERRQLDPALEALSAFIQTFPDHEKVPEATFLRGQVHAQKGDKKRAAEQLEAALAMSGGTDMAADVLFELAKAKDKLGDPAGAKRARERLKNEYSNSSAAKRLPR